MIQKYNYLLDSNVISEIIKPVPSLSVIKKLAEHASDCAISVTTWHELIFGVEQLENSYRKTELQKFIQDDVKQSFEIIPYTAEVAKIHAEIRAKLKKRRISTFLCRFTNCRNRNFQQYDFIHKKHKRLYSNCKILPAYA